VKPLWREREAAEATPLAGCESSGEPASCPQGHRNLSAPPATHTTQSFNAEKHLSGGMP